MVGFASESSLLSFSFSMRLRARSAARAAPRDGRSSYRDSDLLPGPQTSTPDPRDRDPHARFSARRYGPFLRRFCRYPQKRSPRTRHNPRSMRPAGRREHAPDCKSTTKQGCIATRAASTIKRRHQSRLGQYSKSNTKYVLQNSLVATVLISGGETDQMTYSLTISFLPIIFCVLGIVGGYYMFRS